MPCPHSRRMSATSPKIAVPTHNPSKIQSLKIVSRLNFILRTFRCFIGLAVPSPSATLPFISNYPCKLAATRDQHISVPIPLPAPILSAARIRPDRQSSRGDWNNVVNLLNQRSDSPRSYYRRFRLCGHFPDGPFLAQFRGET